MEAVVIESPGKAEFTQVEDPSVGPQEVGIAVKAAGLCGTDLHIYQGEFPASLPLIPGHEFAGEVIEIGARVIKSISADSSRHTGLVCPAGSPRKWWLRRKMSTLLVGFLTSKGR
jgi:NADPH:quinone reductase-like Zn-dependent oxidoreductase